jgi:hypothetical protein
LSVAPAIYHSTKGRKMVEPTKEKKETTIREGEKTRGKVDSLERVAWFYMKKQHGLTDF